MQFFSKVENNLFFLLWSGRQDSNLRPPVPKTGALPGCATPRLAFVLNKQDTFGKTLFE